jgi:hypothetical protein
VIAISRQTDCGVMLLPPAEDELAVAEPGRAEVSRGWTCRVSPLRLSPLAPLIVSGRRLLTDCEVAILEPVKIGSKGPVVQLYSTGQRFHHPGRGKR